MAGGRSGCGTQSGAAPYIGQTLRRGEEAMPSWNEMFPRRVRIAICLAAICGWNAASGRAQEAPAIHSKVNLVNVAFTARDSTGALLDRLTADDVRIFEDGAEQKIAYFAKSADVPLTLGLIVDASGSQDRFSKQHEKDLSLFLKNVLGPRDRAFLLCFGNHLRLVSDFTQSGPEMMERLKRYEKDSDQFPEIGPREKRDLGTAFYDSVFYSTEEKLASADGRRAILIFSDGEDNSSSHDMMSTIEAAQAANVLVYTIRYTETAKHGELTARNKYGIRVMDRVAKETGAWNVDAKQTDPAEYFRRIAEELRAMYEIGYYPLNPMKDESFRKIVIRPKAEGTTIRAKSGYFAR
jgi:Ca-activated chloride channel family protein